MLGVTPILPLPAPPTDGDLGPLPPSQLPAEDDRNNDELNVVVKPTSVATHTRRIGIIHPPPDIRKIIIKTSQFVAENGLEIEKRIVACTAGNVKFNFLTVSNPYHAYYQHKLSEFRAQNQNSAQQPLESAVVETTTAEPVCEVLEPPEAEQYTVRLPEGITGEELDIIKLTAQFVARNGTSFLTGLIGREINNNPQFVFLKRSHSLFMLFTAFADAYSKVLMPPKGFTDKIQKNVVDRTTVLERCLLRLEWEKSQEQARQKAKDEVVQERLQMALIDWHDFVVVECIDFADDEDEMEMDEEAASLDENEDERPVRIVKNWKRPEERILADRESSNFVVSPITGELIPTSEMSEHIRISLIDPKYKVQKERMFAKIRETTLAQDEEISRNIVGLAHTRPDNFGTTEEEVSNAVKAEIEKKKYEQPKPAALPPPRPGVPLVRPLLPPPNLALNMPRLPTSSISYSAPNMVPFQHRPPMVSANQMVRLPPPPAAHFLPVGAHRPFSIMQLHGMPAPLPLMPQGLPPPPPPATEAPPPLRDEPEPKRQKFDDSALVPEDQFLAQHPGPVRINVSVPNVDEGNLMGQILEISMQSLSETVGSLKEKISAEIQLPANKQKLSGKAGFLKDNLTLAYYNVGNGESLSLSLRERGGRKR